MLKHVKSILFITASVILGCAGLSAEPRSIMNPPEWYKMDRAWDANSATPAAAQQQATGFPNPPSAELLSCGKRSLIYYVDWYSGYRSDKIPYSKITHICHAFITPNSSAGLNYGGSYLESALITTAHANGVYVLTSMGTGSFSAAVSTPALRATLINNIEAFVRTYAYDGVDIDWESPSNATDRTNLTSFIQDLRAKFNSSASPAPSWLITMAVGGSNWTGQWYDYAAIKDYVNFFNLMTYDMNGSWSSNSGHNAPLYRGTDPQNYSCQIAMNYLINTRGIPASKVNMGLAFYARTFPDSETLYDSCGGDCSAGGALNYNEMYNYPGSGWTYHWDAASQVPYLTKDVGTGVISYDNPDSIKAKVDYALNSRNAGGVFVWQVEGDYITGTQPLLDSMYNAITKTCSTLPSVTPTNTSGSPTATPTATPTPTSVLTLAFEKGEPILAYPNPANKADVKIRFSLTAPANQYDFRLFTLGMRVVKEKGPLAKSMAIGENEITIEWTPYFSDLVNGVYLYYLTVMDAAGVSVRSRPGILIISR